MCMIIQTLLLIKCTSFLFISFAFLSNSPLIPKSNKERPSKVTLDSLHEYIKSLEKHREKREAKLQSELEAMLDNEFRSLEDNIHI